MASENPLRPFLTGIADAIRYKKPKEYEYITTTDYDKINELVTEKTGYGTDSDSAFYQTLASNEHSQVLFAIDYRGAKYLMLLMDQNKSLDLNASNISIVGDMIITNNSSFRVNFYTFGLTSNKWKNQIASTTIDANGGTNTTWEGNNATLICSPFENAEKKEIIVKIDALDFESEIRNLPEGGELYGDSALEEGFTIDSGISRRPGPYDSEGYNYDESIVTPSKTETTTKSLTKSLTNYTEMNIIWNMQGSSNDYGDVYSKVTIAGNEFTLFEAYSNIINGDIVTTLDITNITGEQSITVKNYAYTRSSHINFISQAVTNIKGIYLK